MYPTTTSAYPKVSAREMFVGRKLDYSRDCRVKFGEYIQTHEDLDVTNTMQERTIGAVALGPWVTFKGHTNF